jgi:hypothetical protein
MSSANPEQLQPSDFDATASIAAEVESTTRHLRLVEAPAEPPAEVAVAEIYPFSRYDQGLCRNLYVGMSNQRIMGF